MTTAIVALEESRRQRRGQIYVALAAVAWSTAGVLQRQLTLDTPTQVCGRAAFARLALLAYVVVVERGRVVEAFRSVGGAGIAMAVCVATASARFISALNHTSVARVLFLLAVAPVLAALMARVTLGEPITRRTAVAMAMAMAGVALMLGAPGEGSLAGDGLALVAASAFALMIVITRWRHDVSMAPATCLAQVILVVAFLPLASPGEIGGSDVFWLATLGIGQIGLGFALLTVGARLIPAAQVGLITLLEVVLGPLWVWLAIGERPSTITLAGGAIVIVAIVVQTRAAAPPAPPLACECCLHARWAALATWSRWRRSAGRCGRPGTSRSCSSRRLWWRPSSGLACRTAPESSRRRRWSTRSGPGCGPGRRRPSPG